MHNLKKNTFIGDSTQHSKINLALKIALCKDLLYSYFYVATSGILILQFNLILYSHKLSLH